MTSTKRLSWMWKWLGIFAIGALAVGVPAQAAEIVVYGFEDSLEGWIVPDWEKSSADYAINEVTVSAEHAKEGSHALEMQTAFPGDRWTGAYVERQLEVTDWTPFGVLSVSVYLPPEAPAGLRGRIILTVGEDWQWTEMNHAIALKPGTWTTLSAKLTPGSLDWKFFPEDAFRKDIRKLGVRIESDHGPSYLGSVFLDDVRLAEPLSR